MEEWEQYQHRAAELLRELGFGAEIEARLAESNGAVHEIDVAARRTIGGVDVLWIIECKYWKTPIPIGKVRELRGIVLDLGADRGLLMSESGFQSGAIRAADQKNITLTSLADLRANAADEILATRVTAAENRLMDLALKVNRGLRPFTIQTPRMLAAYAARLSPGVIEGFSARAEAIDYVDGLAEVLGQVEGLTPRDQLVFMAHPREMAMPWRPGVDHQVMDGVAAAIHYTTQALYQGRLGQWPAMSPCPGAIKLSWSMAQLIDVTESMLPDLEENAAEQEAIAARTPRPPWFDAVKPGTMPLPKDVWGKDLDG